LTAEKDFDLSNGANLFVRGDYQYTSKTQMDPTNLPITQRPAFDLVNASVGYSPANSHWTVALWGKNLADKQYLIGANLGSFVAGTAGDPRTFGVRINYKY
jgi:iron complex outermembrane receptor protein